MDVLVLGWSDIVRRRVVPALLDVDAVRHVHVATTSDGALDLTALGPKAGRSFTGPTSVSRALETLADCLVYVSGRNTDHAARVLAALGTGHDVVVDKPAFISSGERQQCLAAAAAQGRMLAEAVVWPMHAQVAELIARLQSLALSPTAIRATFAIPALPMSNFRTQAALGGGVVADMGVYAMSPARVLGAGALEALTGDITARSATGLDHAFTCRARYADGLTVDGSFSLDGDYVNRLELAGDEWSAALQPAYSSRPDATLDVALTVRGRDLGFSVGPSDPFTRFLDDVINRLAAGDRDRLTERTAVSSEDLLALASTLGVDWEQRRDAGHQESEDPA